MLNVEGNTVRKWVVNHWKTIWYMLCFLLLGLIDQQRGSATGEIQMLYTNVTGLVMVLLILPSLNLRAFSAKIYRYWTPACLLLTVSACVIGVRYWDYTGQWITGVLNLSVWSYLFIYLVREWKCFQIGARLHQPFFLCIFIMFFLMQISMNEGALPLWYIMIYGGFYLIGINKKDYSNFLQGMLNGIIVWFFIQQAISFAFRHYDYANIYARYRGLYSGSTQNGLFYMLVYCAFLVKWVLAREKHTHRFLAWIYFLLSACCVSFMIFTGGRSALLGAAIVTVLVYVWHDIVNGKSFYRFVLHGIMLVICIVLTFPAVYGGIRYLPTILHHPVWFEGEYVEGYSVCSFDPWDSPKYISFDIAVENNLGRILNALGINYYSLREKLQGSVTGMKVYAKEMEDAEKLSDNEPGSSSDNPYTIEGVDLDSAMGARKVIYTYFWNHLNLIGHTSREAGFYMGEDVFMGHAHNMFLQMAYDYGIPVGILFLGIYLYSIIHLLWKRKPESMICVTFLLAIAGFGLTEMTVVPGQITVALVWILFYFAGEDSKEIKRLSKKNQ